MPPGFEPLLAAVCAAPWDDLPRLVFADWLDDNGWRARAEFIRLQCEAARGGPNARECQSRADKLYRRHWQRWPGPPSVDGVIWTKGFRRGFVSHAIMYAEPTPDRLAAMFAAAPVQRLGVNNYGSRGRNFVSSAALAGLNRLDFSHATDPQVIRLAANSAAGRLEYLQLAGAFGRGRLQQCTLTDAGIAALVESPYLARLRWLRVFYASVTPPALAALRDRFGPGVVVFPFPG